MYLAHHDLENFHYYILLLCKMMTARKAACDYLVGRVKAGMVLKVRGDLEGWHRKHGLADSLCFAGEVPLPVEGFLLSKVVHQPLILERLDRPLQVSQMLTQQLVIWSALSWAGALCVSRTL